MERRGLLDHTIVHGVFVGLARSGKNSSMERLLGGMPSDVSPSTGVAEDVVHVKVEKSNTVAANIETSVWSRMEYDDEAIKLMLLSSSPTTSIAGTTSSEVDIQSLALVNQDKMSGAVGAIRRAVFKKKMPNPMKIFKEALSNRTISLQQHFKKSWSLYLTNTGGQIEFQEVLPLLVSGPSIFFYVFRLDRDLNQRYVIEYDHPDRVSASPYISNFTTIEAILQTLATIASMGTFVYKGLQKSEVALQPKLFFIGTHKDKLDRVHADSHIASIDGHLQEVIESTSHYENLVEFASSSRLIFAVNNFSDSDSDFQNIRLAVERVIERDQFEMSSPVHWLIFSLALRKLKADVISYEHCFEIARLCGISTQQEFNEALHFLHTKMGVVRYFPYDCVKDIVMISPQFLFDKVTDLIVDTFTFEKAGKQLMKSFKQKGIFSLSEFEKIGARKFPKSVIKSSQFGKLLEHLRVVAPFHVNSKQKYFLPCALAHVHERKAQPFRTSIPQLFVAFETGYCPKGLAGALIKYLMVNEMELKTSWSLLTDEIYRNEVSFNVGAYDTVIFNITATHFVMTCIPDTQFTERADWPVEKTCTEVVYAVELGIKQVLADFSYIKVEHHLTFPCQAEGCTNPGHPAKLLFSDGLPRALFCSKSRKRFGLPPNFQVWGLRQSSTPLVNVPDSAHVTPDSNCQQSASQQSCVSSQGIYFVFYYYMIICVL